MEHVPVECRAKIVEKLEEKREECAPETCRVSTYGQGLRVRELTSPRPVFSTPSQRPNKRDIFPSVVAAYRPSDRSPAGNRKMEPPPPPRAYPKADSEWRWGEWGEGRISRRMEMLADGQEGRGRSPSTSEAFCPRQKSNRGSAFVSTSRGAEAADSLRRGGCAPIMGYKRLFSRQMKLLCQSCSAFQAASRPLSKWTTFETSKSLD
jgi:hypothetical protein